MPIREVSVLKEIVLRYKPLNLSAPFDDAPDGTQEVDVKIEFPNGETITGKGRIRGDDRFQWWVLTIYMVDFIRSNDDAESKDAARAEAGPDESD